MRTFLPQNTILSRANTVTVDAEKFAQLNSLTDIDLRRELGTAMAKLVRTYLEHVIKENPDFTVGQALEVIELMAKDVCNFTGIYPDTVDEYKPEVFKVTVEVDSDDQSTQNSGQDDDDNAPENGNSGDAQGMSASERNARLFNSFGHKRIKMRQQ